MSQDSSIRGCFVAKLLLFLTILLGVVSVSEATADLWLCPFCQTERIEREAESETFDCPRCETAIMKEDLTLPVAYLCMRTRPTQVVWGVYPECGLFRTDGFLAIEGASPLWVPWSAIDYYIPRMRILRLTSGEEIKTPYALGPSCKREDQPIILATVADSVGDWTKRRSVRTWAEESKMSDLFIIARSPAARDSARSRFISEVEAGKHPRLPRTLPKIRRLATPTVPQGVVDDSLTVILQVRTSEKGRILKASRLRGSGNEEVDRAALLAAYRSSVTAGGELGVGVPSSMVFRYQFANGTATVEGESAIPPMWEEWVAPPLE